MGAAAEFLLHALRSVRVGHGLSQDEFGREINYSGSHVSAVKTGQRPPRRDYLEAVDAAFKTGGMFVEMNERLAILDSTPPWLQAWVDQEQQATLLRWYEPAFIPGLLQTEAYARALLATTRMSVEEIEQRVAARLARQVILEREKPPQLVAVIDEMVLRRPVGNDPRIVSEQIEQLIACAQRPHVQIHVVPTDVGVYPGLQGGFILATLPDHTVLAHLDHQVGVQIVNQANNIATLHATWDAVLGEALSCRKSLDLLMEAAKTWT